MSNVEIDKAKTTLVDLVEAALQGEEVIITKDDRELVRLVPVSRPRPRPRFGSGKGRITIAEDFDEPLEDFGEYTRYDF